MRSRIYIFIFTLFFLVVFYSCNDSGVWDPFKVRGATVSETRILSPFVILEVHDKIDVYYKQDTTLNSYSVEIVTGKNLLPNITTKISGGVLTIKNKNEFNFLRGNHNDVTVYVTTPFIGKIIQDGVGTIYCSNTIKQDTLSYQIKNSGDIHLNVNVKSIKGSVYGVGDIYLNGTAQNHQVYASGECFVNAENLVTGYSFVDYYSSGEAHIYVTGEMDAVNNYSGNIYYSGSPSVVHKSGTGSGELIKN